MSTRELKIETLRHQLHQELDHGQLNQALDKLDYSSLRCQLGTIRAGYISIRHLSEDSPPGNLKMGVAAFEAMQRLLVSITDSGLLAIVQGEAGAHARLHIKEVLPSLDADLVDDDDLLKAILDAAAAKDADIASDEELAQLTQVDPRAVADLLVVDINSPVGWKDRPQVEGDRQARRLEVAGLVAKMLAGGVLLGTNAALGVLSTSLFSIPALAGGSAPTAVAIIGSAAAGLTTIGNISRELAVFIRPRGHGRT